MGTLRGRAEPMGPMGYSGYGSYANTTAMAAQTWDPDP